jgi:hypothetical protein
LQEKYFADYGFFYERKAGEFHDGIKQGFVAKDKIINRLDFIKAYKAFLGEPAAARRTSERILFREDVFYEILHDKSKYHEMFFAFLLFKEMETIQNSFKQKSDSIDSYGYSLLYGKWAVIASIGITKPEIKSASSEIFDQAEKLVASRLSNWHLFDEFVRESRVDTKYFSNGQSNYELYYKINLLDDDVKEFFLK